MLKKKKKRQLPARRFALVWESVPEGVRPLVPAQLTADAVGDGGDKLAAQAQLRAKLQGKLLWRVLPLRHIPLELVHQRDVPNMDVQLEHKNNLK